MEKILFRFRLFSFWFITALIYTSLVYPQNGKKLTEAIYYYYSGSTRIYGSELITNSIDRTMELGTNVVLNGTFSNGGNWTPETGWSISGGTANHTSGSNYIFQSNASIIVGTVFNWKFDVVTLTSGTVQIFSGSGAGILRNTTGTYAQMINAGAGLIYIGGTIVGSIDNAEVRPCANIRPISVSSNNYTDTTYYAHAGSFGVEIISNGGGNTTTDYVYMPSTRFTAVTSGSKYRVQVYAYTTTANTTLTFNLGDVTLTKNVSNSGYTALDFEFTATASTTGNIKLYNNQAASVKIDDLSFMSYTE